MMEALATRVEQLEDGQEKLESAIGEIREKLEKMAVDNASRDGVLNGMDSKITTIQQTTQQTNDKLLGLLEKSMEKKEAAQTSNLQFYQKLLLICAAVGGTIVLAAYGIKEIAKLPM